MYGKKKDTSILNSKPVAKCSFSYTSAELRVLREQGIIFVSRQITYEQVLPAVVSEPEGPQPGMTSKGQLNQYSELPLWGTAGGAVYQAIGDTGVAQRLWEMSRTLAWQGGNIVRATGSAVTTMVAAMNGNKNTLVSSVGGTALLAGLTYAWYSMFSGDDQAVAAADKDAEETGALTSDEITMLDEMEREQLPVNVESAHRDMPKPTSPFAASEMTELKQLLTELTQPEISAEGANETRQQPNRSKRSLGGDWFPEPSKEEGERIAIRRWERQYRKPYWERRYHEASDISAEKEIFNQLRKESVNGTRALMAAPRESFPFLDPWFTLMELYDVNSYSATFKRILWELSISLSLDPANFPPLSLPPYTDLPGDTWLDLGKYHRKLYKKLAGGWSQELLRFNAPLAREYSKAVAKSQRVAKKLNEESNNRGFDRALLKKMDELQDRLEALTAKLEKFAQSTAVKRSGALKGANWLYIKKIPANEFFWQGKYSLTYLDSLELSKFTENFKPKLTKLIQSSVERQTKRNNKVDIVRFYTELSTVVGKRLLEVLNDQEPTAVYNYAVLDEQLTGIIQENISRLWSRTKLHRFIEKHNKIMQDAEPLLNKMIKTIEGGNAKGVGNSTSITNNKIHSAATEQTNNRTMMISGTGDKTNFDSFKKVNWDSVFMYFDTSPPLREERFNAQKYILDEIAKKNAELIEIVTFLSEADILNPNIYFDKWVMKTLQEFKLDRKYSPETTVSFQYPSSEPETYTLRDIARGFHRNHRQATKSIPEINWPSGFNKQLESRFHDGIDTARINFEVKKLFADSKPKLRSLYNIMSKSAALRYIRKKTTAADSAQKDDFYHKTYLDAVTRYLEGKNKAQLLNWHGKTVSGLLFIPIKNIAGSAYEKFGVILSVWNGDYYEIPWPGLAMPSCYKGLNKLDNRSGRSFRPAGVVEGKTEFRTFMEKALTPRVGRRLREVSAPFDYDGEFKEELKTIWDKNYYEYYSYYYPPFEIKDSNNEFEELIRLQEDDFKILYDELIHSQSELDRAALHELFNTLSIVAGVLLMGGGMLFGGPAWAWVLASLTTTLLLDVVPNSVLGAQADDDDERQLYLHSIMLAIAFEIGGNIMSEAVAPLVKQAVLRLSMLGRTALRTTFPNWYELVIKKMQQARILIGFEALRRLADQVDELSLETKIELNQIVTKFKGMHASSVESTQDAASSIMKRPVVTTLDKDLAEVAGELRNRGFDTCFRVLSRWNQATDTVFENQFVVVAKRGSDIAVVEQVRVKGRPAYVYLSERQWMTNKLDAGSNSKVVLKYYDYDDFAELKRRHAALSDYKGNMAAHQYIEGAFIFPPPEEYKALIKKNTGVDFDTIQDYQRMLIPHPVKPHNQPAAADKSSATSSAVKADSKEAEEIRRIQYKSEIFIPTNDFDTTDLLSKFKANDDIARYIDSPIENSATVLMLIAKILKQEGFTDIRYRGIIMWISADSSPKKHFVVLGRKNNIDYAFDLAAKHFDQTMEGLTGPILAKEEDWVAKYRASSYQRLIKYKDFTTPDNAIIYFQITPISPGQYIDGGMILGFPGWYLALRNARIEAIKSVDVDFSLSEKLLDAANKVDKADVWDKFELLPEPGIIREPGYAKEYKIALTGEKLKNLGPDIEEFYPLAKYLDTRHSDELIKKDLVDYYKSLPDASRFEKLGEDIWTPTLDFDVTRRIRDHFSTALRSAEQALIIMNKADNDPVIMNKVLGILARSLNEKDIKILMQAYKRMKEITQRTYAMAYFHVIDKNYTRIVPLKFKPGHEGPTVAFVYKFDPAARIYIVLDNSYFGFGLPVVIHELTHLSVGSLDFKYFSEVFLSPADKRLNEAHAMFGSTLHSPNGLEFGSGQYPFADSDSDIVAINLTDKQKALAQARLRHLPMLRANAKMLNADSITVIYDTLLNTFSVSRVALEGMNEGAWSVKIKTPKTSRNRNKREAFFYDVLRAGAMQSDVMDFENALKREVNESVLASFILMGSFFKKSEVLTDNQMADNDFD
ncbi:hypothetical protein ACQYRI_19620 [Salmonella enterica]